MAIIISALNTNGQDMFYKGYGEELTVKGLGSGELTGTNRIPVFTGNMDEAKDLGNFIDAKRVMGEIIDSVRYGDIYNVNCVSIHFL